MVTLLYQLAKIGRSWPINDGELPETQCWKLLLGYEYAKTRSYNGIHSVAYITAFEVHGGCFFLLKLC